MYVLYQSSVLHFNARNNSSVITTDLIPKVNANQYVVRVPMSVRWHRHGRHIWGVTSFENKDYVTLGCETMREARRQALFYGRWHVVEKWITLDEVEPF